MYIVLVPSLLKYSAAEITVEFSDKYLSQASLYCYKKTACDAAIWYLPALLLSTTSIQPASIVLTNLDN